MRAATREIVALRDRLRQAATAKMLQRQSLMHALLTSDQKQCSVCGAGYSESAANGNARLGVCQRQQCIEAGCADA